MLKCQWLLRGSLVCTHAPLITEVRMTFSASQCLLLCVIKFLSTEWKIRIVNLVANM